MPEQLHDSRSAVTRSSTRLKARRAIRLDLQRGATATPAVRTARFAATVGRTREKPATTATASIPTAAATTARSRRAATRSSTRPKARRAIRLDLQRGTTGTPAVRTARCAATVARTPAKRATTATASTPTAAATTARSRVRRLDRRYVPRRGVRSAGSPAGNNGNTCRADCTVCGDGRQDAGEACDDGNGVDTDGCRNNCTLPVCGDGIRIRPVRRATPTAPPNAPSSPARAARGCGDRLHLLR
jgi:cysteine-rich repeat protein